MIKAIREFFYKRGLKARKRRALYEVSQDLRYIEEFKGTMLDYDEGKARSRMAELKRKETRTPEEESEYEQILGVLAISKAVKNEYEKSTELLEDLKNYISLLS